MAKTRLTTFSKLLITLAIVAGIVLGFRYCTQNTDVGRKILDQVDSGSDSADKGILPINSNDELIKIGVVTWGGYAGGQYFNEGFKANKNSRFYKDYGLLVEFKVIDDLEPSRAAWKNDEINLLWATIDALPTEMGSLSDYDPVVLFQADWSRGGDAVVVRRGINTVSDLRGKRIAVAELSPSHSFLLYLLKAGGLTANDIEIYPQASAIDAATAFKAGQVDAAVVWSPDDEIAIDAVPGSKILESTRSASNIIADVFIAKRKWVEANQDKVKDLYEGWMIGAGEINSSASAKKKAAKILSENFVDVSEDFAMLAIENVRLATHGDNQNFFGLNSSFKGVTGEKLYSTMEYEYRDLGFVEGNIPNWRQIAYPKLVRDVNLMGAANAAEANKKFTKLDDNSAKNAEAIATKHVSVNFRTGESQLDENAKYIIDKEFVDIAKAFSNARIRIEGNTDDTGSRETNLTLSRARALAVVNYLVNTYNMDRNRFVIIGNGPDNPIASNATPQGRAQNRRTDFELIPD